MADALDSKSSGRKVVWVQVPPPVLFSGSEVALIGTASLVCRAKGRWLRRHAQMSYPRHCSCRWPGELFNSTRTRQAYPPYIQYRQRMVCGHSIAVIGSGSIATMPVAAFRARRVVSASHDRKAPGDNSMRIGSICRHRPRQR
jgi:hypothetical protein